MFGDLLSMETDIPKKEKKLKLPKVSKPKNILKKPTLKKLAKRGY
jgi:hypothetical protein